VKLPRIAAARPLVVFALTVVSVTAVVLWYIAAGGVAENPTESMPTGTYLWVPFMPIERGAIVASCLPEATEAYARRAHLLGSGPCNGMRQVVKIVAAVDGDEVLLRDGAVCINGVAYRNSARHRVTRSGRAIELVSAGTYHIHDGQVWLMAPAAESWDSRYYGVVPEQLVGKRYVHLGTQPRLQAEGSCPPPLR
jgi:conjugative transfer signal peptidase TraF